MVYELELHLKTWHATANINPPFREEGCNKVFMHSNDFFQSSFSKFLAIFFSVSFGQFIINIFTTLHGTTSVNNPKL